MTTPPACGGSLAAKFCIKTNGARRLTARCLSQLSLVTVSTVSLAKTAALLIRQPSAPSSRSARGNNSSTAPSSARSAASATAAPPFWRTVSTKVSAASRERLWWIATANPSSARASTKARPIRCAPPVTNAALGIGGTARPPVRSGSPAGTTLPSLFPRPHLRACDIACRNAGAPCRRTAPSPLGSLPPSSSTVRVLCGQTEIGLLETPDLVPKPRRLFEFQLGGGFAHSLLEIADDGF